MFDHVEIRVRDRDASLRFYEVALGDPTHLAEDITEWRNFGIAPVSPERPVTQRLHVGFRAHDREEVDRWWQRMTDAGYESDGEPGVRPWYHPWYYGAFVIDPDGNSVESVHHHLTDPEESLVDHLWLRTTDVSAARRFYETVGPAVGISLVHDSAERVRFSGGIGSFSFVDGDEPTANVHLAFSADDRATVDAFHRAGIEAGHRDNGGPGERPQYHAGYYGAFLLDPDGHNVEAVFHDRPL